MSSKGLNERRCIIRHELGFYRGLATAALYTLPWPPSTKPEDLPQVIAPVLQQCVRQHPILGAVIDSPDSEEAAFRRLPELQLAWHIHLLRPDQLAQGDDIGDTKELTRKALEKVVNEPFPDVREVPPWRVFVVPLSPSGSAGRQRSRALLIYNYSHSHGDGLSGLAFHHSFLQALRKPETGPHSAVIVTGENPLPPAPERLPISWSYLLAVIAKELLPWLPRLLFWKAAQAGPVWTGRPVFIDDANDIQSGVKLILIDNDKLQLALKGCKERKVKLTGLLHLVIVRSLTAALRDIGIDPVSFATSTPIDLRKLFDLTARDMGVNASAVSYQIQAQHPSEPFSESEMQSARELTAELARCSSTTQDQVVGLLTYATPLKGWLQGKMGKARDTTYEVSNVMSFDPGAEPSTVSPQKLDSQPAEEEEPHAQIESIYFSQPADVTGPALSFNVVSLKGSALSIAIAWQYGALGIETAGADIAATASEEAFITSLVTTIEDEFTKWVAG